jgi:molybdopterin converting factor small subunit
MSITLHPNGSHPIALVKGGENKYFIYLDEKKPQVAIKRQARVESILDEKLDHATIRELSHQLKRGATLGGLYDQYLRESMPPPDLNMKLYRIPEYEPDEKIEILPTKNTENIYVVGPNGSGKSWIIGMYARRFHKMFPNKPIILFCRRADDPAYDDVPRTEIVLDSTELAAKGKTIEDITDQIAESSKSIRNFANSLVIFDDVDNLTDKKLLRAVHALCADLLSNGRKEGISVIYVSHIMLNAHQTRAILNEASKVYFFPQSSGTRGIGRFLKEYAGLENDQVKEILSIDDSRWVMISRVAPRYIASEKSIFLL